MNIQDLKKEMPYKWRIQEAKEHGANCVAYIDARQVMDTLDEIVGAENWQSKYESHNNNLYCSIGIKIDGEWVWKTDCGSESNIEKEKGEASDALKRAAVQWGIGRFLYNLPIQRLKTVGKNGKFYPADESGQPIYDKDKLTDFINSGKKSSTPKPQASTPTEPKVELPWLADVQVQGIIDWAKKEGKGFDEVMTSLKAKYRVNKNNTEAIQKGLQ